MQFVWGISEKRDGQMKIRAGDLSALENRKFFFKKLGLDVKDSVSAGAVHGNNIRIVGRGNAGQIIENTDGLITADSGVILIVTSADCLPLYFFDEDKKVIGLAHAGWRGVVKNIVSEMIKKMCAEFGTNPADVFARIGPHIKSCHFEIRKDVEDQFFEYEDFMTRDRNTTRLDLAGVVIRQLKAEGVQLENINVSDECTFCLDKKYFSFRRDKPEKLEVMLAYNMMV